MSRRPDQILVSGAQWQAKGNEHKQKNGNLNMKKNFFILQLTEHWNRLLQWGCVISGDIQNLPRHGPEKSAVAEPGFFRLDYLQRFLPMPIIFWLCVSLKKSSLWIEKVALVPDSKLAMAKGSSTEVLSSHTCTLLGTFKIQYCI